MATLDLEILQGSLEKLTGDDPDIQGAAIVSPDGLILVSSTKDHDMNDRIAAMTSEMLAAGNMTVRELDFGSLYLNMVFGTLGGVIVRGIDDEMVVTVLVARTANVGKVVMLVNATVARLKLT